jgi:hypothetical protein
MQNEKCENQSLELLRDVVKALGSALNLLAGQPQGDMLNRYRIHSVKHIFRAADGFISLRALGHTYCSKLLVRPAIETMFRLEAVRRNPDKLYEIAAKDHAEDQKLLREAATISGRPYDEQESKRRWDEIDAQFQKEFPDYQFSYHELGIAGAAGVAQMMPYYNSHYRTYSQYTHGHFRATSDLLDETTDPEDTRTVAMSAFVALNTLAAIGNDIPELQPLYKRLTGFDTPPTDPNAAPANA